MRAFALVGLTVFAALGACAAGGAYPSLKPRPFELAGTSGEPPPQQPPLPASAETIARVAALLAQAEAGQRAFAAELAAARPAIAAGGAASSESWIMAHQRLSALDASRTATVTAMAELDAMPVAAQGAGAQAIGEGDLAAIRTAGEQVMALIEAQQRVLEELGATLAPA